MWLEEAEEIFKGYLPYYVLVFLPIFILVAPASPVIASHEFPVYRMQHFDLHGVSHGCRSAAVSLEARSLTGWTTSRHCVVVKLQDLTVDHFRHIRTKAGALLVVIPNNLLLLTPEEKEHLLILEDAMLAQEISIPVYFSTATPDLSLIVEEISQSLATDDKTKSAFESMVTSISANGYQVIINPKSPNQKTDIKIATIQGFLVGQSNDGKTPTIAVVAHYDSFGVAPELSFGADSNASGVSMLLELVRLFSTLYSDPRTRGKYNIVFLLTGGGKLNYQGSKKWLEDQLDSLDGTIIQEAAYVMCLDTLAAGDSLYMHVSKPPKEGAPAAIFYKNMKSVSERYPKITTEGVHKKINLAEDLLAWEHERFSIRRLPAFTLSSLKSHKDPLRGTILDTKQNTDLDRLKRNTEIVAEALASQIYNVSLGEVFGKSLKVEMSSIDAWMDYLSTQPRAAQILCQKDNAVVNFLKDTFSKYLRDVRISYATPDKRDPDFMFYDVTKSVMNVYSVKPAVFDLVLTCVIVLYLLGVYAFIQKFPSVYSAVCNLTKGRKKIN
ncbi:BOS complex subunit NCLN [Onthophagus taurus]|uniref:BOS complex subunit NCLN n=1 Tax=Onthophagus taurus TaxID=166361 RepID=UPI000C20A50D|nr:nicalin [Onthophagus taurus]